MQTINLNQNSFRLFPTIYMVQNDTGRELKMILDDVTLDGTETGAVAIKRSDGSFYTITATIDTTNNAFDADMTQALTQPSRTECQLKVTAADDTVISSYTFVIFVQPSTDGVSEEQLGINPQDLINAAAQLTLSDNDVKLALLQIAEKTAYIDQHGQDYYDALEDALYPPIRATSVTLNKNSLVFSGFGGTDTLVATVSPNNVEDDTVYWGSSDKDVAVVSDGVVIATGLGNCTITAICNTKSASASVSITSATLLSISAVYTQSGTVYNNDNLDDLKTDLVVTAHWSDNTTSTVASSDYTLSGSLTTGTSTITVTYDNETTTFTVTVTDFYVNNVFTLDGIKNTRNGHSSSTTTWEDLSGNNIDFAKKSGANSVVWGADHAIFNATNRTLVNNTNLFSGKTSATVELVFSIEGGGSTDSGGVNYGMIFTTCTTSTALNKGLRVYSYNTLGASSMYNNVSTGYSGGASQTFYQTVRYIALVYTASECKRYVDGELAGTTNLTFPGDTNSIASIGGLNGNNDWLANANIYRIGFSSTALSAADITARYNMYKNRFGME